MIYLFLDADEYLLTRKIAELRQRMGDAEMADLNCTELDGPQTRAADLLYHASTMPFLAERRLVIARAYLSHLDKRMAGSKGAQSAAHDEAARLLSGLVDVPETNDLVFVDRGLDKRRGLWKGFSRKEGRVPGIGDLVRAKRIVHEELATPRAPQLPGWIARTAREVGIPIEGGAVQMLANFVGPNLRQLHNELEKLAAYADGRPITPDDVRMLVSDASEALIWDLTDALSRRDGRGAMRALHDLRRGDANPFYLLTMIARQYRIMIKVKEAVRHGGGNEYDIASRIGERPYPVKKAMAQVRNYRLSELETVMDRLLTADHAMKTGADPETAIDILVAELTGKRISP